MWGKPNQVESRAAHTLVAAERVRVGHDGEVGDDADTRVPLGSDSRRGVGLSAEGARRRGAGDAVCCCWAGLLGRARELGRGKERKSWAAGKAGKGAGPLQEKGRGGQMPGRERKKNKEFLLFS